MNAGTAVNIAPERGRRRTYVHLTSSISAKKVTISTLESSVHLVIKLDSEMRFKCKETKRVVQFLCMLHPMDHLSPILHVTCEMPWFMDGKLFLAECIYCKAKSSVASENLLSCNAHWFALMLRIAPILSCSNAQKGGITHSMRLVSLSVCCSRVAISNLFLSDTELTLLSDSL